MMAVSKYERIGDHQYPNMLKQKCYNCGQDYWDAHVCPRYYPPQYNPNPAPLPEGCNPVVPITEERLRQIIREEIQRSKYPQGGGPL
jgi:hypothetical protein